MSGYLGAVTRVAVIQSRLAAITPSSALRPAAVGDVSPLAALAAAAAPGAPALPAVDPLPGARRTQGFGSTGFSLEPALTRDGVRYAHYHDGVDLAAAEGTPVRSIAAGEVLAAGRTSDGAVIVKVRHADGSVALYGHLQSDLKVALGDQVAAGQPLGQVGMTGNTTGPHLHLELADPSGRMVDPTPGLRSGDLADAFAADAALSSFEAAATRAGVRDVAGIRDAAARTGVEPGLIAALVERLGGDPMATATAVADALRSTGSGAAGIAAYLVSRTGRPDGAEAVIARWSAIA